MRCSKLNHDINTDAVLVSQPIFCESVIAEGQSSAKTAGTVVADTAGHRRIVRLRCVATSESGIVEQPSAGFGYDYWFRTWHSSAVRLNKVNVSTKVAPLKGPRRPSPSRSTCSDPGRR
jgi:hypothetical protein